MQTSIDRAATIRTVDCGSIPDQQVHERQLHARIFRMAARRRQPEDGRSAAVRVGLGVNVGTGIQ